MLHFCKVKNRTSGHAEPPAGCGRGSPGFCVQLRSSRVTDCVPEMRCPERRNEEINNKPH